MAGIVGSFGGPYYQMGGPLSAAIPPIVIPPSQLVNWKTIGGGAGGATAGDYISLGRLGAQYQVTALKTLVAPGFLMYSGTSASDTLEIGYADTALVAAVTATAPTNPMSLFAGSASSSNAGFRPATGTNWYPVPIIIPAGKYVYYRSAAGVTAVTIAFTEV